MNRYSVCWLRICPFERLDGGILRPNRDDYPYRLCVLDKELSLAIDVKSEASYDYIRTSLVYFLNEEAKKIEDNKRYAIMELHLSILGIDSKDYEHANNILNELNNGKEFVSGNTISNEEYLENINNENNNKVKIKNK